MSNLQSSLDRPPLILAVDTSSARASLAIARGAEIIALGQSDASIPHSKIFFDLLPTLLRSAGLSVAEIDLFASATGPGSFTGLRVGLSAIKGLSDAMDKPSIGISSLDAVALTSRVTGKVLALIDAGREEVYAGLREIGVDGIPKPIGTDVVDLLPNIIELFNQHVKEEALTVVILSDRREIVGGLPFRWQIVTAAASTAEEVAIYAGKSLNSTIRYGLHPYYVRPSDAEMKRLN